MSSDDQHFLDILGGVSTNIRNYSTTFLDATDKQVNSIASTIKSSITASSWLPQSVKPAPPPPLSVASYPLGGYIDRTVDWIARNKAITAAVVTFVGAGSFMIYHGRREHRRKRRARRAANGARREVVVLAGPPGSLVTKSLMLDLERRGFIVCCIVRTEEEERMVRAEATTKSDISPFYLSPDLSNSMETEQAVSRFRKLLSTPQHAFAGATPHELIFSGLILAPDLIYPSGPIETFESDLWFEEINTKLLTTIATAQAFLPCVCEFKSRIIVLTPNVVASLQPAFHGMESTIIGALDGFTTTLRRELSTVGIKVCHIKLGNFDFSGLGARTHLQSISSSRIMTWPASAKSLYAQNFINQGRTAGDVGIFGDHGSIAKGSSPRELHNAVFDALTQKRPRSVCRVGRGSLAYDLVGNYMPAGFVGWVMGLRKVSSGASSGIVTMEDSAAQSWEKIERAPSPDGIHVSV